MFQIVLDHLDVETVSVVERYCLVVSRSQDLLHELCWSCGEDLEKLLVLFFEEEIVVEVEEGNSHHSYDQDEKDQEGQVELQGVGLIRERVGVFEVFQPLYLVLLLIHVLYLFLLLQFKQILLFHIYLFEEVCARIVHLAYWTLFQTQKHIVDLQ